MTSFKGSAMTPVEGRNPSRFGEIPNFPVGSKWPGRRQLCDDGVHAYLVKGIHGRATEGAYSVVLSGGYEDDRDFGYKILYTGEGGRSPRNKEDGWKDDVIKDQEWKGGNKALKMACRNGVPVRLIRGFKLDSPYAPAQGYRYDGLYTVTKARMVKGKHGFKVCQFVFRRRIGQVPIPGTLGDNDLGNDEGDDGDDDKEEAEAEGEAEWERVPANGFKEEDWSGRIRDMRRRTLTELAESWKEQRNWSLLWNQMLVDPTSPPAGLDNGPMDLDFEGELSYPS